MKKLIAIFLIIFSITGYSQNLKTKKVRIKGDYGIEELYFVLKSDNSIKHGRYIREYNKKLSHDGNYIKGEKKGIWKYYDWNETVELEYNYDNNTILNYKTQTIPDSLKLLIDRRAILLGSSLDLMSMFVKITKYPDSAKEAEISGKVLIGLMINAEGKVESYEIVKSVSTDLDNEALRVVKKATKESEWIPAIKDDTFVKDLYIIPINFKLF